MKLNANNNGQKESLNHNTPNSTKENSMKNSGVVRTYELLHDVELLSVGEDVLEYVASVRRCEFCDSVLTAMGDCLNGCFAQDDVRDEMRDVYPLVDAFCNPLVPLTSNVVSPMFPSREPF